MVNINNPSKIERKREFHANAPAEKHAYRLNRYLLLRLAGEIWEETLSEKLKKSAQKRASVNSTEFARGLGFADKDKFEPSNFYNAKRSLTQIPDPEGYTVL